MLLLLLLTAFLAVCVQKYHSAANSMVWPSPCTTHPTTSTPPLSTLPCLVLSSQVQTISFLSHLRDRGVNGPFLIIGPLSTLRNWSGEVKRWCPSMPVLEYHGSGAKARAALRAQHMPIGE